MNLRLINIKELGGIQPQDQKWLRGKEMAHFPSIENAYLTILDGRIADFGPMNECPSDDMAVQDCTRRCVMPAFVDAHTHLVYSGTREEEFNMRLQGATYEAIAAAGGGILNSAKKVGDASEA
jgi:imidazolonepropionase